ncbi:MAG: hypothetical protein D6806_02715 [Deltaproteobacteria bacterium]|nr:MAG: hypothetical protein D6806_02715 [Deltaproteobacteria bacterium]
MRERLLFIVTVAIIVAMVPLAYWFFFERELSVDEQGGYTEQTAPKPEPAPPLAGPEIPAALAVADVKGEVEISHGGGWARAEVGQVVDEKDRIRTGLDGLAVLSKPGVFSIELDSSSEFEVRVLTETANKFLLSKGMLQADVLGEGKTKLEVEAGHVSARTKSGTFRISVDRRGQVFVGSRRGKVEVRGAGKVVKLEAGFSTTAEKGRPPSDPFRVPRNLLLKVSWPSQRVMSRKRLALAGRTEPGARLKINGKLVEVDGRGRFRKVIVLREGSNYVRVEAYDAAWRRKVLKSPRIVIDTKADPFQIQTSPEMWEKRRAKDKGG